MANPRGGKRPQGAGDGGRLNDGGRSEQVTPGTTGRYLVLLRSEESEAGGKALTDIAGLRVANSADFSDGAITPENSGDANAVLLQRLGVAIIDTPPDQIRRLGMATSDAASGILAVEPERYVYTFQDPSFQITSPVLQRTLSARQQSGSAEFLLGYREGVNQLVAQLLNGAAGIETAGLTPLAFDESRLTWGLQATRVAESQYSGQGIRVAVLDTGMDLEHPDFAGRTITSQSFVEGEEVQDGNGHGTHCIGTSCGSLQPETLPRYGVAHRAEIYAGKVLGNDGSGTDGTILPAIEWAVSNQCVVISMSLGADVSPNQSYSRIYERVARRALRAGSIIIAAAGNASRRPGTVAAVGHPANCPSIMAVGAVDADFQICFFSSGGRNPNGGQVDIAGPGDDVYSSYPMPTRYRRLRGTSMATPHVSGIAALIAEADENARGRALWQALVQLARRLDLPSRDVGAGLVQAP